MLLALYTCPGDHGLSVLGLRHHRADAAGADDVPHECVVPVVGLLSSAAALSEPLDVTTVVGLLLIVSAVAAVSLADAGWFAKS